MSDNINFNALKVLPHMIELLGKDFPHDTDSVWISSVIFFDILEEILVHKIKTFYDNNSSEIHSYYRNHCAEYCLRGFSNRNFYKLYPDIQRQNRVISWYISLAGVNQAKALGLYLKNCETLDQGELEFVEEMIERKEYNFGNQVFGHVCAELALELLSATENYYNIYMKLFRIFQFSLDRNMLSETEFLIIKTAMLRK